MRLVLLIALISTGCQHLGTTYGGGDGLTLTFEWADQADTEISWPGAARSDLRRADSGGPFAYVYESDGGSWSVRVVDDSPFDPDTEDLAVPCREPLDSVRVSALSGGVYLEVGLFPDATVRMKGEGSAEGDGLEGFVGGDLVYDGDLPENDGCQTDGVGARATRVTATWAFDEDVVFEDRCFGCGTYDPNINITF